MDRAILDVKSDTGDCIVIKHVVTTVKRTVRKIMVIALTVKFTHMRYIVKTNVPERGMRLNIRCMYRRLRGQLFWTNM